MSDAVDHPRHYNSHPSGVEAIIICEHLTFNVGNAVKYLFRAGIKTPDPIEDLKKAAWYIARELWRLTKKPGAEELFRSECDALRRRIVEQDAELVDYEKTVTALREQLREEQARRASYQAVDAAARRFIAVVERLEETTSRPIDTPVNDEITKLATAVRYA